MFSMFWAVGCPDLSAVCSHLLFLPPSAGITLLLQHSIYSQIPPHLCSLFSSLLPKPLDKGTQCNVPSCSFRRCFLNCRLHDKSYRQCCSPFPENVLQLNLVLWHMLHILPAQWAVWAYTSQQALQPSDPSQSVNILVNKNVSVTLQTPLSASHSLLTFAELSRKFKVNRF